MYVRKGNDLEGYVRNMHCVPYFKSIGYEVLHPQHIFVNPNFPWIRANLDGLAIPCENEFGFREGPHNNIVIEIKWVSEWAEDSWGDELFEGIPKHYYMQVQTYLAVTEAKKAILFALFDKSWKVKRFEIRRNEAVINRILTETKRFYDYNMCMKIPPKIVASLDSEDLTEAVKNESLAKPHIEDAEMNVTIANYLEANSKAVAATKEASALKDEIIKMYLDGKRPKDNIFKVGLTVCKISRFDSTKFKADNPALYSQYVKESEYTRFNIK